MDSVDYMNKELEAEARGDLEPPDYQIKIRCHNLSHTKYIDYLMEGGDTVRDLKMRISIDGFRIPKEA